MATKIVIENGIATGVAYLVNGVPRTARAQRRNHRLRRRIQFAAVAATVRHRSGRSCLRQHGIEVIRDAPAVGAHLQDHFYVRLAYRCSKPITMNELANSLPRKIVAMARYVFFKDGPLAANGVTPGAFGRSDPRLERPDLQFNFSPFSYASRGPNGAIAHEFPGFSLSAVHLRPDARGTVHDEKSRSARAAGDPVQLSANPV